MPVKRKRMNSSDKAFRALLREPGAAEALIRERFDRRTVRELVGRPEILPRFLDLIEKQGRPRGALDFKARVLDLGSTPVDAISKHSVLRGGLIGLKVAATPADRQASVIRQALGAIQDASTRARFIKYIGDVADHAALVQTFSSIDVDEEEKVETYNEYHRRIGRQRGRKEGRAEVLREMTRKLIRARFERIPTSVSRQLTDASEKTLALWFSRALRARSISSIFEAKKTNRRSLVEDRRRQRSST